MMRKAPRVENIRLLEASLMANEVHCSLEVPCFASAAATDVQQTTTKVSRNRAYDNFDHILLFSLFGHILVLST